MSAGLNTRNRPSDWGPCIINFSAEERERERETAVENQLQDGTQTQTHTDTQTHRHTDTHRHTQTLTNNVGAVVGCVQVRRADGICTKQHEVSRKRRVGRGGRREKPGHC